MWNVAFLLYDNHKKAWVRIFEIRTYYLRENGCMRTEGCT